MEHMYFQGTYPTQSQTDSTLNGTYLLSRHISDLITNGQYTSWYCNRGIAKSLPFLSIYWGSVSLFKPFSKSVVRTNLKKKFILHRTNENKRFFRKNWKNNRLFTKITKYVMSVKKRITLPQGDDSSLPVCSVGCTVNLQLFTNIDIQGVPINMGIQ